MDRLTNRVHDDLLAQVASTAEEEAHVRRILSEPLKLREEDLDAHERYKRAPFAVGETNHAHRHSSTWPNCCGACDEGRTLCHSPQACQISVEPDPPRKPRSAGDIVIVIALVIASWAAVAFVLLVMGVRL